MIVNIHKTTNGTNFYGYKRVPLLRGNISYTCLIHNHYDNIWT